MNYFYVGSAIYIVLSILILVISLIIIIAPLFIWRNGNRTNRLLYLFALQQGIKKSTIDNYFYGMSNLDHEQIRKEINFDESDVANNSSNVKFNSISKTEAEENKHLIDRYSATIKEFYPNYESIIPSPYKFYVLIKNNNEYKLLKIGGFKVNTISKNKLHLIPKVKEWMDDYLNH